MHLVRLATGFLWGGLVRIFFEHHVTWSVNSVCHIWEANPTRAMIKVATTRLWESWRLGEGCTTTIMRFPTSARHGLAWWQFDSSWIFIKMMSWVGMARKIKLPTQSHGTCGNGR